MGETNQHSAGARLRELMGNVAFYQAIEGRAPLDNIISQVLRRAAESFDEEDMASAARTKDAPTTPAPPPDPEDDLWNGAGQAYTPRVLAWLSAALRRPDEGDPALNSLPMARLVVSRVQGRLREIVRATNVLCLVYGVGWREVIGS